MLELIKARLGCGYIKPNSRTDRALVYVVRDRDAPLGRVIPFFERNPLLSSKQADVETFACSVRAMARREHLTEVGFDRLLDLALSMGGSGRSRRVR